MNPRAPTIVDWLEETDLPTLGLSEPSKTWVDRMWHAALDGGVDRDEFLRMDGLFDAYLDGLAARDREEAGMTEACFVFLMEFLGEHCSRLPRCACCGAFVCPHCGCHPVSGEVAW